MRLLAGLMLAAPVVGGCSLTTVRDGDPHYVLEAHKQPFKAGETTSLEVAQALGPPDLIETQGERLVFEYRFRDRRQSSLILSYYLNVFQRLSVHSIDSRLLIAFDEQDRLLYWGVSELPTGGQIVRHFN
ncbi:MAG: hypothetical protein AB7N76_07975 [Planctomycetota bacterium]